MSETTTGYTPTDEDVERASEAVRETLGVTRATAFSGFFEDEAGEPRGYVGDAGAIFDDYAAWVLTTIGPIVERERRAAKVEALRWAASQIRSEHQGHPFARLIAKGLDGCADDIERGA